jgi:hypothetical protein
LEFQGFPTEFSGLCTEKRLIFHFGNHMVRILAESTVEVHIEPSSNNYKFDMKYDQVEVTKLVEKYLIKRRGLRVYDYVKESLRA